MGLFDFLHKDENGQFLPEDQFDENLENQMQLSPLALDHLRLLDFDEDRDLKFEFFFYTNHPDKAKNLAEALEKLGYQIYQYGECGFEEGLYSITGLTDKMKTSDDIVANWAKQMCELGYIFDCNFDGWGTTPQQE